MADFDIRDIAALKVKLQIIEKLVLADWILIILSMYYDWGGVDHLPDRYSNHPVYLQIETAQTTETERVSRQSGRRANNRTPYPARPSAE